MPSRRHHLFTHLLYLCSFLPILPLLPIHAEGFYTASVIGHLPRPYFDGTPNGAVGDFFTAIRPVVEYMILAMICSPPVWLALMGWNQARANRTDWRIPCLIYSFGWVLIVTLCCTDAGGILAWWID